MLENYYPPTILPQAMKGRDKSTIRPCYHYLKQLKRSISKRFLVCWECD